MSAVLAAILNDVKGPQQHLNQYYLSRLVKHMVFKAFKPRPVVKSFSLSITKRNKSHAYVGAVLNYVAFKREYTPSAFPNSSPYPLPSGPKAFAKSLLCRQT